MSERDSLLAQHKIVADRLQALHIEKNILHDLLNEINTKLKETRWTL